METTKDRIQEVLDKHNITVDAEFIPFSKSRSANNKDFSLNWKVTILQNGRKIITTDYMAGMGHTPSYKLYNPFKISVDGMSAIKFECTTGKDFRTHKLILPDAKDVVYSLIMDSEALDYPEYEEWANNYGYDEDSRMGEKLYRQCLEIGLKLRQMGDDVLAELREVYQDY